jgi:hypothetical protein
MIGLAACALPTALIASVWGGLTLTRQFKDESQFLKKLRNKAAFHFDRDVLAKGFKELDFKEARFASGRGWQTGSTYFDIVDDAVLVFSPGQLQTLNISSCSMST